jgi:hypothetical protein
MWILLAEGIFLFVYGCYELAVQMVVQGLVFLLAGAFALFLYGYIRLERDRGEKFLSWVAGEEEAIRLGAASLGDRPVTPDTPMTRYSLCLSFVLVTIRIQSGWYLTDRSHTHRRMTAVLFSAVTLLLGWWGFPFGPIRTLEVLGRNLMGGERMTVQGLVWTPGQMEE